MYTYQLNTVWANFFRDTIIPSAEMQNFPETWKFTEGVISLQKSRWRTIPSIFGGEEHTISCVGIFRGSQIVMEREARWDFLLVTSVRKNHSSLFLIKCNWNLLWLTSLPCTSFLPHKHKFDTSSQHHPHNTLYHSNNNVIRFYSCRNHPPR
jgi:hypothetical protein